MLHRRDLLAIGATSALAAAFPVSAEKHQVPERVALWPKSLPEPVPPNLREGFTERSSDPALSDRSLKGVAAPWLEMFRPARPNGAAIIAMPGGGYRHLAWDKEGLDIARWFAAHGVTSFALAYRLPNDGWQGGPATPLADAQRAMRLVRANAAEWGIDPWRIAVTGFSAGGHLCANLAAQFALPTYAKQDGIDDRSARPDLAAPIYPAIAIDKFERMFPTGQGLFGKILDAEQLALHAPHRNVPDNAPPHFLVHAEDDPAVSPDHSLALRAALLARKIPVETHFYAKGGHGFGIRNAKGLPVEKWPEMLLDFGRSTGWILA